MTDRLLAIESATDSLSIALFEGDALVSLAEAARTRQHASVLLPLIDDALHEQAWSLSDVGALAVSTGPGAFTSLRIGLATAKGLAFGREMRAVGVSTLEAMAARAASELREAGTRSDRIVTLLDARRGEWYAGAWRLGEDGSVVPVLAEGLYSPAQLCVDLTGEVILVCPEPPGWQADFEAAGLCIERVVAGADARPRADWVGRLGTRALAEGRGTPPRDLAARYLRRAEAEAKRLGGPVEAGELARVGEAGEK